MQKNSQSFISRVFIWLAVGLILTGAIVYLGLDAARANIQIAVTLRQWGIAIFLLQMVLGISLSTNYQKKTTGAVIIMYLLFTGLMGLWLIPLMFTYDLQGLFYALLATVVTFVLVSIWGAKTKRDLTQWGSFAIMALIGIIVASLINFIVYFLNPALAYNFSWGLTYFGLGIFLILQAANMQNLKKLSQTIDPNGENVNNLAVIGALGLYLNFINMLLYFLRITSR